MQNMVFLLNMIDHLAGDETYIPIRTRQRSHRTLQQIEKLVDNAQDNVIQSKQDKEKQFEDTLRQTEQDLRKDLIPLQNSIKSMKADKRHGPEIVGVAGKSVAIESGNCGKQVAGRAG